MKGSGNSTSRPAQIILLLRLVAGAYLIYLAYELIEEVMTYTGQRQLILLACMALFAITGAGLGGWTIKKLIKGEFIRPGEVEEVDQKQNENLED